MPWFWEIEDVEEAYYAKDDKGSPEQNENQGDKGESGDKKGTQKAEAVNWLEVWVQLQSLKRGINGVRNRVRVWKLAEEVVARIGQLREDWGREELSFRPSKEEERSKGRDNMTNGYDYVRCRRS